MRMTNDKTPLAPPDPIVNGNSTRRFSRDAGAGCLARNNLIDFFTGLLFILVLTFNKSTGA